MTGSQEFDAFERAGWAGRAEAYGTGFVQVTGYAVDALLSAAEVRAGNRVLDVGTGSGVVAGAAVRRGATVDAVDADPEMAALAGRNVPAATVGIAVLPSLPYPDATFDAVVGNFVVNHTGDPVAAVAELRRVLRPGGRLALTMWRYPQMRANTVFRDAVAAVGVPHPPEVPETSPIRAYGTPETFAELLAGSGLGAVAVEVLSWEHRVDPDEWWVQVLAGTAVNSAVIARQTPAMIGRIKEAYDELVGGYRLPSGEVSLPACALVGSGRR